MPLIEPSPLAESGVSKSDRHVLPTETGSANETPESLPNFAGSPCYPSTPVTSTRAKLAFDWPLTAENLSVASQK